MSNMSWPTTIVIAIIVLVAGYFVGQALHLDHKTTGTNTATVVTAQPLH